MTYSYFQNAKFTGSYPTSKDMPPEEGSEIAFCGRSNCGKSSVLNALTNNKKLAKTSKTPGRTQAINVFEIGLNGDLNIIDLPGYGYAKVSKVMRDNLAGLIQNYIENQAKLIQTYVLIDARVGLKNSDIDMFDLLSESNRKFSIVFTKIDKCSKSYLEELENSMQSLMKSYNKHFNQFFFTSAKKFEGIIDIQKDIYALSKQ